MLLSVDYAGLAGVKHFQHQVTYREENHGQSRVMANLEEVAKSASEYSKSHIYEIFKGIQMIIDPSSLIRGKQYRYFIRFDCICDDGCLFNIGATKPDIKTRQFVVTTNSLGVGNQAGNMGFSSLIPIPATYYSYVEKEINSRVKDAKEKCTSACASVV